MRSDKYMDEFTLIELISKNGIKNVVCQLLAPRQTISLENVEETRSYVVAIDDAVRYCFTCNPGILDPDSEYVVLTITVARAKIFVRVAVIVYNNGYCCFPSV